ncbi:MAG: RES family NAD+ phosphorylase [Acidobacteria bacterium]|nr:RES family NAD+ phosphorylase [Acidobacteriota bacterium]
MLYRVFPFRRGAAPTDEGGALHVPRTRQGSGRHDNPDLYGALYVARAPVSAVAERIQAFRGQPLADADLRRADGTHLALASIDDAGLGLIVDLDDPQVLLERSLRPSGVATLDRGVTQTMARALFAEGVAGFEWWSVLEASWGNLTLFAERSVGVLGLPAGPEPLTLGHPALRAAAQALGIRLARG